MKLHKNQLRSTMGQDRMNSCLLMSIHRDIAERLDTRAACVRFVQAETGDMRRAFFGNVKK